MKKQIKIVDIVDNACVIASKYCVRCYPKKVYAEYTYKGDSLCEGCLKEEVAQYKQW